MRLRKMSLIDYVNKPVLKFRLKVLDDGEIDRDILEAIFENWIITKLRPVAKKMMKAIGKR